jgi:hypothetical protein
MELKEFINKSVENGFSWKEEEYNGVKGYYIGSEVFDTVTHFSIEAIEKNEWPVLKRQIVQGKNIHHITRIVGYYSRIENWNKSKKGELKDRHKGDYQIK